MRVDRDVASRIGRRVDVVVEIAHLVLAAQHRADVCLARVVQDGDRFADLVERAPGDAVILARLSAPQTRQIAFRRDDLVAAGVECLVERAQPQRPLCRALKLGEALVAHQVEHRLVLRILPDLARDLVHVGVPLERPLVLRDVDHALRKRHVHEPVLLRRQHGEHAGQRLVWLVVLAAPAVDDVASAVVPELAALARCFRHLVVQVEQVVLHLVDEVLRHLVDIGGLRLDVGIGLHQVDVVRERCRVCLGCIQADHQVLRERVLGRLYGGRQPGADHVRADLPGKRPDTALGLGRRSGNRSSSGRQRTRDRLRHRAGSLGGGANDGQVEELGSLRLQA